METLDANMVSASASRPTLNNTPLNFEGGKLAKYIAAWSLTTIDPRILNIITGVIIEFDDTVCQLRAPNPINFSPSEQTAVDCELTKLLNKRVIEPATKCEGQFISNIFLRPKRDGTHRVILNLKQLNKDVTYRHFKMDTLKSALELVTQNCFFCSVDFKDAFYSVRVHPRHRKFLRFYWDGNYINSGAS